jgi:hypothetical protein
MARPSTRSARLAIFALALSLGGAARAERVAALAPTVTQATLREGLRASLAGGVAAAGHDAIAADEIDRALAQRPALAACVTDVCLAQIAQLLSARAIVHGTVEVIGSSNYSFRVELYDAREARVSGRIDDTCAICTVREANEALSRAAASLGRRLVAATAIVTPVTAAEPVRIRSTGTPRSRLFAGLGAGALVLGLGAIGGGAALIALDGSATGTVTLVGNVPTQELRQTLVPGIVLTSAGGVLLAGAGVLFWRSHANRRR